MIMNLLYRLVIHFSLYFFASLIHANTLTLRVEEEQNLPDSPDDAASSTGSDVGTGNFATAATLMSDEGISISLNVESEKIDDCLILQKIFDNLAQLYPNTPVITGTYFYFKKLENGAYKITRILPEIPNLHPNTENFYLCPFCDYKHSHYTTPHTHVINHLEYRYHCTRCNKSYKSSQSFKSHKIDGRCNY